MADLKIAKGLSLPVDVVTLTTAVLGIRGSGKTNTGVVIAEELLDAGHQVVIIDPLDVWWGLRSSADGKRDGYPITVLGGIHGDVPLSESDGKVVADFVVENRLPAILSLRHLSKSAQRRLVADFAEQVYRRKGEASRNTPCLFIVDEASAFVPQRVDAGEARMVGAIEDWVRRGRASGIGAMLIDQRAATVNKDVLTQIELLVCHRTTSPQDRAALKLWIQAHDTAGKESEFMASIASLTTGEAWFWSPAWLDLFKQAKVRARRTFDSSATPRSGQVEAPRKVAAVDLERLKGRLQETIERAKADDPKELKRQIAELRKQLAGQKPVVDEAAIARAVDERDRFWKGEFTKLQEALANRTKLLQQTEQLATQIQKLAHLNGDAAVGYENPPPVHKAAESGYRTAASRNISAASTQRPAAQRPAPAVSKRAQNIPQNIPGLSKKQQQVIDAVAWWESIGVPEPSNAQVGAIALIDTSGGYFSNVAGPLVSSGLIERGGGTIRLTDAGRAAARPIEDVGTLADYHNVLRERVRRARNSNGKTLAILDALIAAGGSDLTNEQIGDRVGIDTSGGYYSNSIGPLSTLGLIERRAGVVRPTELLFPVGVPA